MRGVGVLAAAPVVLAVTERRFFCDGTYASGYRKGEACIYLASAIVDTRHASPIRVCGYHARAYRPEIVYPLDWSLARIRRWQLDNLRRVTGGEA